MRNVLFILFAIPLLLWAQTDWSKSPYETSISGTDEVSVGATGPSLDGSAGQDTQVKEKDEKVFIDGLDRSGFFAWLMNSRTYYIQGDTAYYDQVEPLVSQIPKAKEELQSSRSWSIVALVSGAFAIGGIVYGAACKGEGRMAAGYTVGLVSFGFEIFSGRVANNHYNSAINLYNAYQRGDYRKESDNNW